MKDINDIEIIFEGRDSDRLNVMVCRPFEKSCVNCEWNFGGKCCAGGEDYNNPINQVFEKYKDVKLCGFEIGPSAYEEYQLADITFKGIDKLEMCDKDVDEYVKNVVNELFITNSLHHIMTISIHKNKSYKVTEALW
jgi:hypothetical protein